MRRSVHYDYPSPCWINFRKQNKCICIITVSQYWNSRDSSNPSARKIRTVLIRIADNWRWLGDARSQEISSHNIYLVVPKYPGFSTRRVNNVLRWASNPFEGAPLRWRHNGRDSVSNHQPHDCLLNRSFRRRSKKTSNLRVTGLCVGNSPFTGEFPAQIASNAENVSIWWRHHASPRTRVIQDMCARCMYQGHG